MISYFNPAKVLEGEAKELEFFFNMLQGEKVEVPWADCGYYSMPLRRLISFNLKFEDLYKHNLWYALTESPLRVVSHAKKILKNPTEEYFIELMKYRGKTTDCFLLAAIELICSRYTIGSKYFGGPFYKKEMAFDDYFYKHIESFSRSKIKIDDPSYKKTLVFQRLDSNFMNFDKYKTLVENNNKGLFYSNTDTFFKKNNYDFNKINNIYYIKRGLK